jgi:DNA-binding MarR family transcriptional regulator
LKRQVVFLSALLKVVYTTLSNYLCSVPSNFPLLDSCNPMQCYSSKLMKANRLMQQLFKKHLGQFEITMSQLSLLFYIAKKEIAGQQEIADSLFLDKSTVTRNLQRLLKDGFMKKNFDRKIQITTKGKRLVERMIPYWEKAMKETQDRLSPSGEKAIHVILEKLIQ